MGTIQLVPGYPYVVKNYSNHSGIKKDQENTYSHLPDPVLIEKYIEEREGSDQDEKNGKWPSGHSQFVSIQIIYSRMLQDILHTVQSE